MKTTLYTFAIAFLLLFTGCSDNPVKQSNALVTSKTYTLSDLEGHVYKVEKEGRNFNVEGHEDKLILFDMFATWCPPCRAEAPHLANLQEKYKDKLLVLGVTIQEDATPQEIKTFQNEYNAYYTMILSHDNQRFASAVASTLNLGARFPIPLMVIYKNGRYITHYVGAIPEEMIQTDIQKMLEQ